MKLQIDFYSKDEVSVFFESKPGEISDENAFECYYFAWFTLRQLHNLHHNIIVDAFVGLLTQNEIVTELMNEPPELPPVIDLLIRANSVMYDSGEVTATTGLTSAEYFALRSRFEKDHAVNIIGRDYLKWLPRLVGYHGNASKRFIAIIDHDEQKGQPTFELHPEGFGILGHEINYYAPHSIIALFRFLAGKHANDELYLKRLSSIAYMCGRAHKENKISLGNQPELALAIFNASAPNS